MKEIWKFLLLTCDWQQVPIPALGTILSVGQQHGGLCLWAVVDPDAPRIYRTIWIVGTGRPMPDEAINGRFLGTVQIDFHGSLRVWHIFEERNE